MRVGTHLLAVLVVACSEAPNSLDPTSAPAAEPRRADRELPLEAPVGPIGSLGFSRYVYAKEAGKIVPRLIEGPAGPQVRCQDEALPCSYLELKALYESSAEIPEELHLTRKELGELVGQLDVVSDTLAKYKSMDDACAAGFELRGTQAARMGLHMAKPGEFREFDLADPHMILYAKEGGERYSLDEIGRCVGGQWKGDKDFQLVGAAFLIPLSDEHPTGFAGPFDNWHIHFGVCSVPPDGPMPRLEREAKLLADLDRWKGKLEPRAACESSGGIFQDPLPLWMIHAWVVPEFDNNAGVFAMFNSSVWPLGKSEMPTVHQH
jgi:hypothetical protein